MQGSTWRAPRIGALAALLGLVGTAGAAEPTTAPTSPTRGITTGLVQRELHRPPALVGSGDLARQAARSFVSWASLSTADEREDARREILAGAANPDIVRGVIAEAREANETDHSRALVSLAILGEMRTEEGERYLRDFINQPLPTKGTVVEGDLIEATAMASLQAKAVDGLAFRGTREADAEVLRLAGEHPSIIVRAEAISAYLWNHGDTEAAREALRPSVRKNEQILLERVRHVGGESAEQFNRKLEAFTRAHPELAPPPPEYRKSGPVVAPEQNPNRFSEPPPVAR
ncbi:hypothetical protein DRW03_00335 [Corallococcus sp. H22C18031201]|nr:hypothetical protein DRW03_00335 [Corallococcus sp. H22C18031201]